MEDHERRILVDYIWNETFGNGQEQDGSNEEVNEDPTFEFKDPDNTTATEMEVYFAPLDL